MPTVGAGPEILRALSSHHHYILTNDLSQLSVRSGQFAAPISEITKRRAFLAPGLSRERR